MLSVRNFLFSKKSFIFLVLFALLTTASCKLINSDLENSENPKSSVEFAFSKTIFKSLTDSSGQSADACQFKIVISGVSLDSPIEKLWEVSSENLETTVYFIDDLPVACELSIDACILIDNEVCYKAGTVKKSLTEGNNEINFVLKKVANSSDDETSELLTITTEACDEGIKVTVSYSDLVGSEHNLKNACILENTTGFSLDVPDSLNEKGSCSFNFPFTESGKEYSFGISGNYSGTAYDGWFDNTLATCTAATTTPEATWYAANQEYFTGYSVDCKYNDLRLSVTRDFPTVKDLDENSALAKIKEMKDSVLNFAGSNITKVEKSFRQFVYGYVDCNPKGDLQGTGSQELTSDDVALTETTEIDSGYYTSYKYSPSTFIDNGYDGRYAGSYGYKITVGSDVWSTPETWSEQEYYYIDDTNIVSVTTKKCTRLLHAVYDSTYEKYIVRVEEHKIFENAVSLEDFASIDIVADYIGSNLDITLDDLATRGVNLDDFEGGDTSIDDLIGDDTSLEDLDPSDIGWTVAGLVEGDDYVAVLYKPM